MRVLITVITLLLGIDAAAEALEWEIITVDRGGKPSLAITSEGVPHISYMKGGHK